MEIGEPRIALCPENAARGLHFEVPECVFEVQSPGYAIVLARISAAVTGAGDRPDDAGQRSDYRRQRGAGVAGTTSGGCSGRGDEGDIGAV